MTEIKPIEAVFRPISRIGESPAGGAGAADAFQNILVEQIEKLSELHSNADNLVRSFASGADVDLHEVVLAVNKADLALMFAIQLRNKVIEAYQEVTRMPV
ncbi:MAG: flagellar hook-basal body complex protein FliE [bacterium]